MGYDSMSNNASVRAISKDFGKKKKANRTAKLKQWKLDARREQWLSQVKNGKGRTTGSSPTLLNHPKLSSPIPCQGVQESVPKEKGPHAVNNYESPIQCSCSDSSSQSPTTGSKDIHRKEFSSISISSGSSIGLCSRSVSDAENDRQEEERVEDDDGLDDWEAVADALSTDGDHSQTASDSIKEAVDSMFNAVHQKDTHPSVGATKPESTHSIRRAWRPDDAARPQTLPNLLKQRSFPLNMELHFASPQWGSRKIVSTLSCPICVEDFDLTDSSFLPCICGFRICLFCHKKILEGDEKCPGCRKKYEHATCMGDSTIGAVMSLPGRFSRSCSMNSRY